MEVSWRECSWRAARDTWADAWCVGTASGGKDLFGGIIVWCAENVLDDEEELLGGERDVRFLFATTSREDFSPELV